MKLLKRICDFLSMLLFLFLIALAAILLIPRLSGLSQYAVLSGSMEPKIGVGALVYDRPFTEDTVLRPGQVITYQLADGTLVTHRIVSVDKESFCVTTKGDANNTEDAVPVAFDAIKGVYAFDIPFLGYLTIYGKTPLGITGVSVVLLLMILFNYLPEIFSSEKLAI